MKIRPAKIAEFDRLYEIGLNTPELRVSANEAFMDKDDFRNRIESPHHIFLIAEKGERIAGFLCVNATKGEGEMQNKYACLVYLVKVPEFRRQGVAQCLYTACEQQLKERGITHIYSWANAEGDGAIIEFFKRQGLAEGHRYVWMDKKL